MEFINKIELLGYVGEAKTSIIGDTKKADFSLCVHENFNGADGTLLTQTTWFKCSAWEEKGIKDVSSIKKGLFVHLKGRVKAQTYTDKNGNDHYVWEVICKELEVLPKEN